MSDLRFACPNCGRHLAADAASAGLQTNCPDCGQPIIIAGELPPASPRPNPPQGMPSRKPGGRRSWARIFALAVGSLALLIAVAIGGLLIWGKSAAKKVNAECQGKLDAIRKAGEPATGAELNVWYRATARGRERGGFLPRRF